MTDDQSIIILVPADIPTGITGSVRIDADCGHRAWISPSGMTALLTMKMRTRCMRCVPSDTVLADEEIPGAREELAAEIGKTRADAIVDAVRRTARRQQP